MVMRKVGVAELKAKLSENLRAVRAGETVTVMDRGTPVADIVPHRATPAPLRVRPPKGPHASFGAALRALPPRAPLDLPPDVDPVEFLIADRRRERWR